MTLALVWGYFSESALWLRWLLAISAVPIAIFSNAIRVAGTGVAAHFVGPEAAEGFLHTFSGWMVFVVAGVMMLAVHRLALWLAPGKSLARPETDAPPAPGISRPAGVDTGLMLRGLVAAALLGAAAMSLAAMTQTEVTGPREPLAALPLSLGEWRGENLRPFDRRVLETLGADEYLNRQYRQPDGPALGLYVGYYKTQRQGQTMHSPLNCLPGAGWEPISRERIAIPAPASGDNGGKPAEINRLVIQKGIDRVLVLYWYQAHGRIVASEYLGKDLHGGGRHPPEPQRRVDGAGHRTDRIGGPGSRAGRRTDGTGVRQQTVAGAVQAPGRLVQRKGIVKRVDRIGLIVALLASLLPVAACSKDPEVAKRDHLARGDKYAAENKLNEAVIEYRNAIKSRREVRRGLLQVGRDVREDRRRARQERRKG